MDAAGPFTADTHRAIEAVWRVSSPADVQGDLLARLGWSGEARAEFERAAALTQNERERALLLARAAGSGRGAVIGSASP